MAYDDLGLDTLCGRALLDEDPDRLLYVGVVLVAVRRAEVAGVLRERHACDRGRDQCLQSLTTSRAEGAYRAL